MNCDQKPDNKMSTPSDTSLPLAGSAWRHHSGRAYTVLLLSNTEGDDPERFVPTVVYQGEDGRVWSRPVSDWHRSMSLLAAPKQTPASGLPYMDSTPDLHVGDSAFESWFESYVAQDKGDKQRARDAYAAGMGDPLVAPAVRRTPLDPMDLANAQVDRILLASIPGGSTALAWFLPYANERGLNNIRDVVRRMVADAQPMLDLSVGARAGAGEAGDLESLHTQVALLKSAVEARGRVIAELRAGAARAGQHLTVTTTPQGEAVMVSWQDDEHRILHVVWERKPKEGQGAVEPVPAVVVDTAAQPDASQSGELTPITSQYARLDELMLKSLRERGPANFSELNRAEVAAEASRLAQATSRQQMRVIDGRLRTLASQKRIIYRGGKWRLLKKDGSHD